MTPIISPWFFYFINLADAVGTIMSVIIIVTFVAIWVEGFFYCFTKADADKAAIWGSENTIKEYENQIVKILQLIKRTVMTFIVTGLFFTFIPTKETCYQMLAASMITPDNITIATETTTNVVDYIVESVDKLLDNDEKGED